MTLQPGLPKLTPKRVLIVNCYFPETRQAIKLPYEVPNALAPVFLAAAFAPHLCEVRLYNEISSGFLEVFEPQLLQWKPDMVVFSGLTITFDRMLHLTAYFRTANPDVVIVAGGPAVRSLPQYSQQFFDYACLGDAEQLAEVVEDVFGKAYVAEERTPRYDLAYWIGKRIAYVESSRNCNFRCSFCSLTAEHNGYITQPIEYLRQQIMALGKGCGILHFQDNQFHGGDRDSLEERLQMLKELRAKGYFKYWHAFVTNAFLWDEENIQLAKDSGCFSLFVGVESFDDVWLRGVRKGQNVRFSQVDLIKRCMDAGILFQYGLVYDPSERHLDEMYREMEAICANIEIPLPLFIFLAIPFPGTPFFRDRFERGLILPNTKLRDLQGSTVSMQSLDPIDEVVRFVKTAKNFNRYRGKVVRHQIGFLRRYGRRLGATRTLVSSISALSLMAPWVVSNPANLLKRSSSRSHVSTTDRLDQVYTPSQPVDAAYRHYFEPTHCTLEDGSLNEAIAEELLGREAQAVQTQAVQPPARQTSALQTPAMQTQALQEAG